MSTAGIAVIAGHRCWLGRINADAGAIALTLVRKARTRGLITNHVLARVVVAESGRSITARGAGYVRRRIVAKPKGIAAAECAIGA